MALFLGVLASKQAAGKTYDSKEDVGQDFGVEFVCRKEQGRHDYDQQKQEGTGREATIALGLRDEEADQCHDADNKNSEK